MPAGCGAFRRKFGKVLSVYALVGSCFDTGESPAEASAGLAVSFWRHSHVSARGGRYAERISFRSGGKQPQPVDVPPTLPQLKHPQPVDVPPTLPLHLQPQEHGVEPLTVPPEQAVQSKQKQHLRLVLLLAPLTEPFDLQQGLQQDCPTKFGKMIPPYTLQELHIAEKPPKKRCHGA